MGCPMAALCFCLALHLGMMRVQERCRQLDNNASIAGYMDDVNIFINQAHAARAVAILEEELLKLGLRLNPTKTNVWICPINEPMADGAWQGINRTNGPVILKNTTQSIPVTPDVPDIPVTMTAPDAPEPVAAVTARQDTARRVMELQDAGLPHHTAQALWRTYTAGDVTFLARTVGLSDRTAALLDKETTQLWQHWLGGPGVARCVNMKIWQPLKDGFTSAKHLQYMALVASWKQLTPAILRAFNKDSIKGLLQHTPTVNNMLRAACTQAHTASWESIQRIKPTDEAQHHIQNALAALARKRDFAELLTMLPAEARAIQHSAGGSGAGLWLLPPTRTTPALPNEHFKVAAKFRLHLPQHPVAGDATFQKHTESTACRKPITAYLTHAICCPYGPGIV